MTCLHSVLLILNSIIYKNSEVELLQTSKGELELSKSFYYLLSWIWDKKENLTQNYENGMDSLAGISGIRYKQSDHSHKTLGTSKSMIGDRITHIQYLMDKSKDINEIVINDQLNERQSRQGYISWRFCIAW
jgi:hypothetical protein